jgi:hypothetical protein
MKPVTVFYAGQIIWEGDAGKEFVAFRTDVDPEIYNGAWVYRKTPNLFASNNPWYRMDSTPALEVDVPKDIRTIVLLLQ